MAFIPDGATITVNGDAGLVIVHDESEEKNDGVAENGEASGSA
jgi:hypothetical protein